MRWLGSFVLDDVRDSVNSEDRFTLSAARRVDAKPPRRSDRRERVVDLMGNARGEPAHRAIFSVTTIDFCMRL